MAKDRWQAATRSVMWACVLTIAGAVHAEEFLPLGVIDDLSRDALIDTASALATGGVASAVSTALVAVIEQELVPAGAIDIKADKLTYDRESGWIEGVGNAVVLNGPDKLTADYVQINTETREAMALGNVVLDRPGGATKGDRLSYNFDTDAGHSEALSGMTKPFYWIAGSTEQVSTNRFVLHNAQVTTCRFEGRHRHFHIRSKELTIVPHESIRGRHAVWYFGRVPGFYTPYWFHTLKEEGCGWTFQPGFDSDLGLYLLSTYGCMPLPWLKTETHLDYYTRRGIGLGQDLRWHQPGSAWAGDLELYSINDKQPWEPDENVALSNVEPERHRVRLRHQYYPSRTSYALLQAYYLSDTDVVEDFFGREFRRGQQPENYFLYTRRGEKATFSLNVRKRLNDFYTTLERMPELSVDIFRQEIGESRFYYEGRGEASFLQWAYSKDSDRDELSALRGDTYHTFYRPFRLFGFLNMIPRASYRGTWYSKTRAYEDVVEQSVSTNGTVQEVIVEREFEGPGGVRSLYELGHEISFKAFRIWDNVGVNQRSYRHIVEPYADYTYIINDGLESGDLYQFDRVERLGEAHYTVLGMRNMLQTKEGEKARDLVDLDIYTVYQLDIEDDENPIEDIRLDAEIRPFPSMRLDLDVTYNLPDSVFDRVNTRLRLFKRKHWSLGVENRVRKDRSDRWSVEADWRPNPSWRFGSFVRYEVEDAEVEDAGAFVQRDYDCMTVRTGVDYRPAYMRSDGSEQEDEYRVMIEFWLTAFPETQVRIR